jgi:hypothetical protein
MRTVTEFLGVWLRQVLKTKNDLVTAGTTDTAEAPALTTAMGEALKIEGDRLTHLMKALTHIADRSDSVSRVRVFQGEDETKMPKGAVKDGDHYYLVEFTILAQPKQQERRDDRGGKGGKGGKGGRGGNDRDNKRGPGRGGERGAGAPGGTGPRGPGGDRSAAPSGDRGAPRAPRAPRPPAGPVTLPTPKPSAKA